MISKDNSKLKKNNLYAIKRTQIQRNWYINTNIFWLAINKKDITKYEKELIDGNTNGKSDAETNNNASKNISESFTNNPSTNPSKNTPTNAPTNSPTNPPTNPNATDQNNTLIPFLEEIESESEEEESNENNTTPQNSVITTEVLYQLLCDIKKEFEIQKQQIDKIQSTISNIENKKRKSDIEHHPDGKKKQKKEKDHDVGSILWCVLSKSNEP